MVGHVDALEKDVRTIWGDFVAGKCNSHVHTGIWDVFLVLNRFESCFVAQSLFSSGAKHSLRGGV